MTLSVKIGCLSKIKMLLFVNLATKFILNACDQRKKFALLEVHGSQLQLQGALLIFYSYKFKYVSMLSINMMQNIRM